MVNSTNPTLIFRAPKCLLHFECDNCVSQWLKKALCFLFTDLFTQTFQTRLLSCSGIWIAYLPFTQYSTMGHWKNNACHRNVNDFQAFTEKSCTHLCLTQCMLRNTKRIRKYWIYWTVSISHHAWAFWFSPCDGQSPVVGVQSPFCGAQFLPGGAASMRPAAPALYAYVDMSG